MTTTTTTAVRWLGDVDTFEPYGVASLTAATIRRTIRRRIEARLDGATAATEDEWSDLMGAPSYGTVGEGIRKGRVEHWRGYGRLVTERRALDGSRPWTKASKLDPSAHRGRTHRLGCYVETTTDGTTRTVLAPNSKGTGVAGIPTKATKEASKANGTKGGRPSKWGRTLTAAERRMVTKLRKDGHDDASILATLTASWERAEQAAERSATIREEERVTEWQ